MVRSRITPQRLRTLYYLLALLVGGLLVVTPRPTYAAAVTTCNEAGLVAAITATPAGGTITFSCSGTITMATTPAIGIAIAQNLTIDAAGQTVTINGGGNRSIFYVNAGVTLSLNNLIITGSGSIVGNGGAIYNNGTLNITNSTFSGNSGFNGGAIYNNGKLNITDSTFSANSTGSGGGGAIYNNNGTLNITDSTFSGNSTTGSGNGGAIFTWGNTITISNSTFSSNSANEGGAIYNMLGGKLTITGLIFSGNSSILSGGAIYSVGNLTASNSTFSGNSANNGAGGAIYGYDTNIISNSTFSGNSSTASGGTIYIFNKGRLTVTGSILTNSPTGGNCFNNGGTTTDGGYNVEDANTCGFTQATSLINTNPLLGPLANNGGSTQTFALLPGSPAIDRMPTCTLTTDQRGLPRPFGVGCDSGAFELQTPPPFTLRKAFGAGTVPLGGSTTLTFTLTNLNLNPVLSGGSFTDTFPAGIVVATPNALVNNCGGTVTAVAGSGTVSLNGGSLNSGQSCTITLNITGSRVGSWTNIVATASSTETGTINVNANATIQVSVKTRAATAPPSDLIPQFRISPDRESSLDPTTEITFSFRVKNVGQGTATNLRVELPIDPALVVGYGSFDTNPKVWVTAVTPDKVIVSLPPLAYNEEAVGKVIFHPAEAATLGTKFNLRYVLRFDDPAGSGKSLLSNGQVFSLDATGRDVSQGAVQLLTPDVATVTAGEVLEVVGDFYLANEVITAWYTDSSGQSVALGAWRADSNGKASLKLDTSGLAAGVYSVVLYGNRSEVSGSTVVTVQ